MTSVDPRPASTSGLSAPAPIPFASMNESVTVPTTPSAASTDLYWRSLGQLEQLEQAGDAADATLAREFADDAAAAPTDEVSRRGFLSAVAASVVAGARVLATADDTVQVWAAASDMGAGDRLTEADLVASRVRFADEVIQIIAPEEPSRTLLGLDWSQYRRSISSTL